tara:strand:- start:5126 stop:5956 length:831 start_codon:yes stop_codon:yes gene_type:complete
MTVELNDRFITFLKKIKTLLETEDLVKVKFEDFVKFLPEVEQTGVLDKRSIIYIAEHLKAEQLNTEPKISQGYVSRHVESPLYIFKQEDIFDHSSLGYKQALLMVRMAVIMAFADGSTDDGEILTIKEVIWDIHWLSTSEKISLLAKASYLIEPGLEIDDRTALYSKTSLSKTLLLQSLIKLDTESAKQIIHVAKDVAVSDKFLAKGEITLLQDMYRVLEMSVRSVEKDLVNHAAKNHEYVSRHSNKREDELLIEEPDINLTADILDDLISEFEDF